MNTHFPENDFLNKVKSLCQQYGAVLIFDETITGFRYSLGGAQQLFSVTPDLATFGKGMANGYPISAIVGRKRHYDADGRYLFFRHLCRRNLITGGNKSYLRLYARKQRS